MTELIVNKILHNFKKMFEHESTHKYFAVAHEHIS